MSTIIEHRVSAFTIDVQTGERNPTTVTFRCNQESFEKTKAALAVNRGAGDSYFRCENSPGFNPCDFSYAVKPENLRPACIFGNSKSTGNRITRAQTIQPFY